MNYRLLLKALGLILVLLAVFMFGCALYAYLEPGVSEATDEFALLMSAMITGSVGGMSLLLGRGSGRDILRKEAIAVVGLSWLLSAGFGALPYIFSDPGLPPADAFFESASGFTTTGSSVIANLEEYSHPILLWRALTQWLGGMGILVLFVAVLSYFGLGSKSLVRHESTGSGQGFYSRIRQMAVMLWMIYMGITAVCIVGLIVLGMPIYDALTHAFATVSTGGFSPYNASAGHHGSTAVEIWTIVFMVLGGMSFVLISWILRGRWDRLRTEEELKLYLGLLAGGTVLVMLNLVMVQDMSWRQGLKESAFQVVSIMTTTGLATADYDKWPLFSQVLLVFLMFIGGCAGSTSGGIKVSRVLILLKTSWAQLIGSFRPNQVFSLRLNGVCLEESQRMAAVFFIALILALTGAGTLLVSILDPWMDIASAFTAVVATLFNIGPGLGSVGPAQNFSALSEASKVLLSFAMLLGRLELFALMALFVPALWRKY